MIKNEHEGCFMPDGKTRYRSPYCCDEGQDQIDRFITEFNWTRAKYLAGIGARPTVGHYVARADEMISNTVRVSDVVPTQTVSMMPEVSAGIEPPFDFTRRMTYVDADAVLGPPRKRVYKIDLTSRPQDTLLLAIRQFQLDRVYSKLTDVEVQEIERALVEAGFVMERDAEVVLGGTSASEVITGIGNPAGETYCKRHMQIACDECNGTQALIPKVLSCECGAFKAMGCGQGKPGHSSWCPWSAR